MGIDLYCGPLVRYYTNNWKTPAEEFAEQAGIAFKRVYPFGQPVRQTRAQAESSVRDFRERLGPKLSPLGETEWVETHDAGYEAAQIRRDGFSALMIWAAYLERPDLVRPTRLPDDYGDDRAVREASERGYYLGSLAVIEAHMAVPATASLIAAETDPRGGEIIVTTTEALRLVLADINSRTWNASVEQIGRWYADGTPSYGSQTFDILEGPSGAEWKDTGFAEVPDDEVEAWATWGFACFSAMLGFADDWHFPIVRDE